MNRFAIITALAIVGVNTSFAGLIEIGGPNGLSAAYITNPNVIAGSNTTGCAGGAGNCVNSATTGWGQRNYTNSLFDATTISNASAALGNQGSTLAAWTLTDPNLNNVTFAMMNDGMSSGVGNNIWASSTSGQQSITIPIGIFGVDDAYVMLDNYYGYAGLNATISFNYSSTATGAITSDVITLAEGNNGPIRSSVDCTFSTGLANPCPTGKTANSNAIVAGAPLASALTYATGGDLTVQGSTIWNGQYVTNGTSGIGPFLVAGGSTSGLVMLDDLEFAGLNTNEWLQSITIQTSTTNSANNSKLALSAITVDQISATPEPASFGLLLAGLGLIGVRKLRRS